MSYQSLFKTISEKLTQPSGIAVMASVGIHLILGATLPYLLPALSREDEAESRRTVELLELSPEDLENLPAIASPLTLTPLPDLPEGFDPEQFQSLPPLASLPGYPSTPLSELPAPSTSRYKFPSIPLPPLRSSQRFARRSTPLPPPVSGTQPQPQDESPQPEESQAETPETEYEIAKNSGVQIPVFRTAPPGIIPSNITPPEQSDMGPQARGNLLDEPGEANENAEPPVDPAQLYAQHRQQVLAQRMKELQRRRAALRRSNENTSDEAARRNLTAWAAEQARQENEETQERFTSWIKELRNGEAPRLNFTPSYPKEACVQKLEGQTVVGALLNPNGSVAESPVLIRSSGYPLFDQKALEAVQNRRFSNETGQKQPHLVDVTFKYNEETCPDLSVPEESAAESTEPSAEESPAPSTEESPAPSTEESPAPSTEESPEPSAQNSPEPSTEESPEPSAQNSPAPSTEESPEPSAQNSPAPSTEEATEEAGTPAAESTGDESEESANSAPNKPTPAPSEEEANL